MIEPPKYRILQAALHKIGLLALALTVLGCTSAQTATRTATKPNAFSAGSATPVASPPTAPATYTVTVTRGKPATIPSESLSIELLSVKDDRCPAGVACVWAGHAAVTLKVSKPGSATRTLTIGSEAPPKMGLPYDAAYEHYLLHLVTLEPGNTQSPTTAYRATIKVSSGLPGQPMPNSAEM